MLFDKKRAIEIQIEEIHQRLQWLDENIDGTGLTGEDDEGLLSRGGERKFALTMPTQQDESLAGTKVNFEVVDETVGKKNGKKRSLASSNSMSMTQPEDYLTDPHTQPEEFLTDPLQGIDNDDIVASSPEKVRRVSKSPLSDPRATQRNEQSNNEMFQSNTPPGLKRSAPTNSVMNPYVKSVEKRGSNANNNPDDGEGVGKRGSNSTNPFQDLWNTNESTSHLNAQSATNSSKVRLSMGGSTSVNTLEKYMFRAQPSNSAVESRVNSNGGQMIQSNNNRRNEASGSVQINTRNPQSDRMMYHLQNTFGISQFRGHQQEIINATMQGKDAFVVMRTGGGKSLTYQLPAVLESESQRKVSIVISPLISLIRDQEEQMNQMRPNSALSFTSGMAGGTSEHARRWALVRDPSAGVALIFVTPEKVAKSTKFKGELEKLFDQGRLGRFVIDECHCACQWGHDFRPDYTKLGILKHHFPSVPVLAVTATASERVRHDCAQMLRLGPNYRFFRSTANRPNLIYSVKCKQDSKDGIVKDMVAFIKENHVGEAGIIYTFSKKEADDVANKLCDQGIVARSYHSGVQDNRKDQIQKSWMRNETQVVVATIAFGLGINKPDVRFVLHHSLSKSLEAYYQESGRAGRNGQPANCVLFYSPKDVPRMLGMIHGEAGEATLWAMVRYGQAHGDDALCRHVILATLGEADHTMGMTLLNLQNNCTTTVRQQIGAHCQTATKVVNALNISGEACTINGVVAKWRSKADGGTFSFLKDNPPGKDLNKEECEKIIVYLLLEDVLHPKIVYTAYSTIVYIIIGPKGPNLLSSSNPRAEMGFPMRPNRKQASSFKNPLAATDEDGWISTRSQTTKTTKTKTNKATSKPKGKPKKPKVSKVSKKKATTKSKITTIVEINSSSSSEEDDVIVARRRALNRKKKQKAVIADDSSDDSDF
eukprot:CAMPEP_0201909238 /NCGR_PEP_ID=MMETSP0903-20130614/1079_1 /ASSEMBLY_ACC=CAM_ASM_000552 /TAXON_ID=420261 /ORGANISM="Thalassiosira antarctica, Strain CCMP982" /LENGTH=935 /DNA_ID=CAMNT_0048443729 /DNA_START=237 /DNA_END=3044 /DNA_ORIENTATION=-